MTRFKETLALGLSLLILFVIVVPLNEMETSIAGVTTAVPLTSRPDTHSCIVSLIQNRAFSTGDKAFTSQFSPPSSCPSPWLKVILDWWGRTDGAQYDRVTGLWVGKAEIFRATTPLSLPNGIAWHVDKDVSEYSSLFIRNQTIVAILPNSVSTRVPGTVYVNASLTFFITGPQGKAPRKPDVIVPISASSDSPWFSPRNSSEIVGSTQALPRNIDSASLEIFATPHSPCDEFWYASDLSGCSDIPFREIKVFIDGKLVEAAWPFPIMYAGAINPNLWRPVPGIDALNIPPYIVNLNPFVGLLASGSPHAIGFQIVNFMGSWRIDGNLLLNLDLSVSTTSGALLSEIIPTNATMTKTIVSVGTQVDQLTVATRAISLSGYVNSSSGHALVNVRQVMSLSNTQVLDLTRSTGHVFQLETVVTFSTVSGFAGMTVEEVNETYFLSFNYNIYLPMILGADVNSIRTHQDIIMTNGTITQVGDYSDAVHTSTLGPIPWFSQEETTEVYESYSCATFCPSSSESLPLTMHWVVGERINVGLTGLELFGALLLIGTVNLPTNRRTILRLSLWLGGYSLAAIGGSFLIVKYSYLTTYHLAIFQFLEALLPEGFVTALGTSLILTELALRRRTARSKS